MTPFKISSSKIVVGDISFKYLAPIPLPTFSRVTNEYGLKITEKLIKKNKQ